jgi:hypothetical protein
MARKSTMKAYAAVDRAWKALDDARKVLDASGEQRLGEKADADAEKWSKVAERLYVKGGGRI